MNKEPATCEARYGIMWGPMGAALDAYESALRYALEREQFGTPVGLVPADPAEAGRDGARDPEGMLVALQTRRLMSVPAGIK